MVCMPVQPLPEPQAKRTTIGTHYNLGHIVQSQLEPDVHRTCTGFGSSNEQKAQQEEKRRRRRTAAQELKRKKCQKGRYQLDDALYGLPLLCGDHGQGQGQWQCQGS